MAYVSDGKQAEIIHAFNLTSRYLDNHFNIDHPYFEGMVNRIYQPELKLNKTMRLIPEPRFWIYIYLFQMDLFPPKFKKSGAATLNLTQ